MRSGCLRLGRGLHAGLPPHPPPACAAGGSQVVPGGLGGPSAGVPTPSAVVAGQGGGMAGTGGHPRCAATGAPPATALPQIHHLEAMQDAMFSLTELNNALFSSFFFHFFFFFPFHEGL